MRRPALLLVIVVMLVGCRVRESGGPLGVGSLAPALLAEGWLNGEAPGEAELAGKVVVVDVWAYW